MINKCPNCGDQMVITSYRCNSCFTEVHGEFEVDSFSRLDKEDKEFIELFLQKRGSIKDVGEEIGISYPTVRNRIDKIVAKLGGKVDKKSHRIDILNMLDNGEITTERAKQLLEEINNDWRKTNNPEHAQGR